MADYNKVGLLVMDGDRMLLCRKHNLTSKLILPGGCIEPNESVRECLDRELREELGEVRAEDVEYIGTPPISTSLPTQHRRARQTSS